MSAEVPAAPARPWLAPVLLVVLVVVAYAPSLGGAFLEYDDDWLIETSPVMRDASLEAPRAILFDLSRETRLVLGAEYLPVRDLVTWASVRAVGTSAPALRGILLALYVLSVLAWRVWFRRMLGAGAAAEIAALVFALHPAHVESVAWLAGIKDVLALLFGGLALAAYAGEPSARRRAVVVALVTLACFSKAVSVTLPALLFVSDAWLGRARDRITLALGAGVALAAAVVHASVGARVGMYAPMPGGDRLSAAATMAPVAFRYVLRVLCIEPASIVYDVPDRTLADPVSLASLAALALLAALAIVAARRGERRPLWLLLIAAASLAPVSQVLAPIQHRMADRYLLVALAAPCLAGGVALAMLQDDRARWAIGAALALALGLATGVRALTFASPEVLWIETTERAPRSPLGPYQLGVLLAATRPDVAEQAYGEALARDGMTTEMGRRAADNLAILLARSGRIDPAIALLEDARAHYPRDPRVAHNLALLLDARGEHERARAMMLEVLQRSPRYAHAWSSYRERWGEPPLEEPTPPRYDAGDRAL